MGTRPAGTGRCTTAHVERRVRRRISDSAGHGSGRGSLVAAHSIATADDIFWLTLDEVQAAAHALDNAQNAQNAQPVGDYHTAIAERRAAWERERKVTPPAALPLKSGYRFLGIDFSAFSPARIEQQEGDVIKGIGASPGRVTGTARVISGPDEFDQMRHGDILVAK